MRRFPAIGIALLALALPPVSAQRNLSAPVQARLALGRLQVPARVLMIAAHPDDENTALLAWLARGRNVRTAYLSLTRGEGGQNLIGPEQGTLLGLIRTQELLAARRIDGAEQFFSSAVDFGFSKTAEEAVTVWGREKVLGDVVYVIRKFRPDVIILRFSGTPRDGHGQHQASAILGKEAFIAAADSARFPEQLEGLQPWRAKRLMWNVFSFNREQERDAQKITDKISVDLGTYDPMLGFSYSEIAGMSRSQHESQGMGAAERRGPQPNFLTTIAGEPAKTDIFDGIATTWPNAQVAGLLREAAEAYSPEHPEKTVDLLLKARPLIDKDRLSELDQAIAWCTGLWLDASADRPMAAEGSTVKITAEVINRSHVSMRLRGIQIGSQQAGGADDKLLLNQPVTTSVNWTATGVRKEPKRGAPEPDPVLLASFRIDVNGHSVTFVRPVHHRFIDKVRGELTRPFLTVPPVSVALAEKHAIFPAAVAKEVAVAVRSFAGARTGTVRLDVPADWQVEPSSHSFNLGQTNEEQTRTFRVTPPAGNGTVRIRAIANTDGNSYSTGVQVIDYPHIPPITVYSEAVAELVRTDVRTLSKRIGYVMGAGDVIPDALRQIGADVTLLSADDLSHGKLDQYDAIVAGVRAYNTRPDLRANYQRLMDYVSNGGTYVVQYNTPEGGPFDPETGALSRIAPYPLKIGRDRITVEEAPVEVLKANHRLMTIPNQITNADFAGWIQERGLYFASSWDPKFGTILSSHDPGEKALEGGLLYARYGKGAYVFTAFSWFRELPAGVPGAYRIFANLLSAGKQP